MLQNRSLVGRRGRLFLELHIAVTIRFRYVTEPHVMTPGRYSMFYIFGTHHHCLAISNYVSVFSN